jgi:hypothetical protein
MTKDFEFEMWVKDNLPKGKETFSRDAVEILLSLLWDKAKEKGARQERRSKYDDYDL